MKQEYKFVLDNKAHDVNLTVDGANHVAVVDDLTFILGLSWVSENCLTIINEGQLKTVYVARDGGQIFVHIDGNIYELTIPQQDRRSFSKIGDEFGARDEITAPMPGKLVKILVKEGETVQAKQPLVIVESMKMENEIKSPVAARVKSIHFKPGDLVKPGQAIIKLVLSDES